MQLDSLTSNEEQNTGGRTSTGIIDEFVSAITENRPQGWTESRRLKL